MGRYSNWAKEEDEILLEIINTHRSKKWIKTSLKLRQQNFHRSPSECRERFINYLAPNIDKAQITQKELSIIYQKYEQLGPKWSIIQQYVLCKTQCKIKNVFYGNVKNLLKTLYKFFTFKTASFVNSISTDYLQSIYQGSLYFHGFNQVKEGIRAMGYKNNKAALISHILTDKKGYLKLLNLVLKEIFQLPPIAPLQSHIHHQRIAKMLQRTKKKHEQSGSCYNERSLSSRQNQEDSKQQSSPEQSASASKEQKVVAQIKAEHKEVHIKNEDSNISYRNTSNDDKQQEGDYCPFQVREDGCYDPPPYLLEAEPLRMLANYRLPYTPYFYCPPFF